MPDNEKHECDELLAYNERGERDYAEISRDDFYDKNRYVISFGSSSYPTFGIIIYCPFCGKRLVQDY